MSYTHNEVMLIPVWVADVLSSTFGGGFDRVLTARIWGHAYNTLKLGSSPLH